MQRYPAANLLGDIQRISPKLVYLELIDEMSSSQAMDAIGNAESLETTRWSLAVCSRQMRVAWHELCGTSYRTLWNSVFGGWVSARNGQLR